MKLFGWLKLLIDSIEVMFLLLCRFGSRLWMWVFLVLWFVFGRLQIFLWKIWFWFVKNSRQLCVEFMNMLVLVFFLCSLLFEEFWFLCFCLWQVVRLVCLMYLVWVMVIIMFFIVIRFFLLMFFLSFVMIECWVLLQWLWMLWIFFLILCYSSFLLLRMDLRWVMVFCSLLYLFCSFLCFRLMRCWRCMFRIVCV